MNKSLPLLLSSARLARAGLVLNGDFETPPFPTSWTSTGGTVSTTGSLRG